MDDGHKQWTTFHQRSRSQQGFGTGAVSGIRGVFDIDMDSVRRMSYDHVYAPEVMIDDDAQRIILFWRGMEVKNNNNNNNDTTTARDANFVATSAFGLNFPTTQCMEMESRSMDLKQLRAIGVYSTFPWQRPIREIFVGGKIGTR